MVLKLKPWLPASLIVNGQALTDAESESLRCAVTAFHSEMCEDDALGADEHGRFMTRAYRQHMERVLTLMGVI
jgi:hypothetical protein